MLSLALIASLLQAAPGETDASVTLRHKFEPGQQIRYAVANESQIELTRGEASQSLAHDSLSQKRYDVVEVDENGTATLVLRIEHVRMSASDPDGGAITYDSSSDDVPLEFSGVDGTIGPPIARITVDPQGEVTAVEDLLKLGTNADQFDRSNQHTLIALPAAPVAVGSKWKQPFTIRVRPDDEAAGTITVKLQREYTVRRIDGPQVTLDWTVRPLTPISDPAFEARIAHRLLTGTIVFDAADGRVQSREGRLDREIIGFEGPTTLMRKTIRVSERLSTPRG